MASDTNITPPDIRPGDRLWGEDGDKDDNRQTADGSTGLSRDGQATVDPVERNIARRHRKRQRLSPITVRILAVNLLPMALLIGGIFYVDQYRTGLINERLHAMVIEGDMIAGALSEGAVRGPAINALDRLISERILNRLVAASGGRARIFAGNGQLIADSWEIPSAGNRIIMTELDEPDEAPKLDDILRGALARLFARMPWEPDYPPYNERGRQRASDYEEVVQAMRGTKLGTIRAASDGTPILTVAVPVQRLRQVLGVVMLSRDVAEIEHKVHDQRIAIIGLFTVTTALTILVSIFLAGTIARPVRALSVAAERIQRGFRRRITIPDFSRREDEIGDLSLSLRAMTHALYERLDGIEAFAADVSHEIKNPLTSMRSALELLPMTKDEGRRKLLMDTLINDVDRLDRLITDISDASRVDAELSRAETRTIDLSALLSTIADAYSGFDEAALTDPDPMNRPVQVLTVGTDTAYEVRGFPDRLGQVFRNLVDNAISFSKPGDTVTLSISRKGQDITVSVEDQGPGILPGKLDAIFDRFYSDRPVDQDLFKPVNAPTGRKRGSGAGHSGLGLSICRQIIEAHRGTIRAENIKNGESGTVKPGNKGARFTVTLPVRPGL